MNIDNKKTILLVEDEAVIAIHEKKALEGYGYKVVTASSGEKAVKAVEQTSSIDLILMDINLGEGIDGTEAASIILKQRDIPIVFLSSHTEPQIVNKTEDITSYGYVVKNSGITVLDASIKMAFKLFDANENLQWSENKFSKVFHSNSSLMALSHFEDGIIVDVNDAFLKKLGFSREEVIGKTSRDLNIFVDTDQRNTFNEKLKRTEILRDIETTLQTKEGSLLTGLYSIDTIYIGRDRFLLAVMSDITGRKLAEEEIKTKSEELEAINEELNAAIEEMEATNEELIQSNIRLEEQEQQFRLLFENTGSGIIVIEEDTTISLVNEEFARSVGYTRGEIEGKIKWPDLVFKDDIESIIEQHKLRRINPDSVKTIYEFRFKIRSGELRDTLLYISMIPGTKKSIASLIDITESKRLKDALVKKTMLLETSEQLSKIGGWEWDIESQIMTWTTGTYRIHEFDLDKLEPGTPEHIEHSIECYEAGDREKIRNLFERCAVYGESYDFECPFVTAKGKRLHIRTTANAVMKNGKITGVVGNIIDITDRKNAEENLRESEERFKALHNASFGGIAIHDKGIIIECNSGLSEMTGYSSDELMGMNGLLLCAERSRDTVMNNIISGYEKAYEIIGVKKNGEEYNVRIEARIIPYKGKSVRVSEFRDITENKIAENNLKDKNLFINSLLNAIPVAVFYKDKDGRYLGCNNVFTGIMGVSSEEIAGKTVNELWPDEIAEFYRKKDMELLQGREQQVYEFSIIDKDGMIRPVIFAKDIFCDANGDVAGLVGAYVDISERIKNEKEREQLKEKLAQSQKMDSVGRLAGGIAHDFNNMLGVIQGYAELSLKNLSSDHKVHPYMKDICKAAEKASNLTRQLLTFARQQVVTPKVLDFNDNVEALLKMLRRIIGENISLEWLPGRNCGMILIDPTQLDQLLFNICVNARDAIKDVGKITIETGSVSFDESYCSLNQGYLPGFYVTLAVCDNGQGIDDETMKHLFEPFFTTKKIGDGTGLGLATVDGIVKQNNGFINVQSESGRGTTFRIFLPQYSGLAGKAIIDNDEVHTENGDETILLVEDEQMLLDINMNMLEEFGYTVLVADTPDKALKIAIEHIGEIHLLITDVVMPGMNGKELAEKIRAVRPGIKQLFMSGYTADIIGQHGVLDCTIHFIQKPFSIKELAKKVRDLL